MQDIRFGTSGWRGIIARDFTFENVARLTEAVRKFLKQNKKSAKIFVAYDNRFMAQNFADYAAQLLSSDGISVYLAKESTPTPAVSAFVMKNRLDGAMHFTASHNPPEWLGVKFTTGNGMPCTPDVARKIEKLIPEKPKLTAPKEKKKIKKISAKSAYFSLLKKNIDFGVIRRARLRVVIDAMHGAGAGWLDDILKKHGVPVIAIRHRRDPLFDGSSPDPKEERLSPLKQAVKKHSAMLGIALDGDADRFGIISERGDFVEPNVVIAMFCDYLLKTGRLRGGLARTAVTTHLIDKVAEKYSVPSFETPVGFKFLGKLFCDGSAVAGGEECAGFSVSTHTPEKDGMFSALLAMEMLAREKKTLSRLKKDFFRSLGIHATSARLDIPVNIRSTAIKPPKFLNGVRVVKETRIDGTKWILENGDWIAFRISGTEPLVRIYAEAHNAKALKKLLKEVKQLLCLRAKKSEKDL